MSIVYILLTIILGLVILILIFMVQKNQPQTDIEQLISKFELLPQLLDERVANRLWQSDAKLQKEFAELKHDLSKSGADLQFKILENTHQFQQAMLLQEQKSREELLNQFHLFSQQISHSLNTDIAKLIEVLRQELERLNQKVELKLKDGFESTTKTFQDVLERLTRIDAAQKKIDELSTEIVSLQDVLTDKKSRGIFGEVQLQQILVAAFGEGNSQVYSLQSKLSTGNIADAILYAPEPLGKVAIDSKFPLENYRRMVDANLSPEERKSAEKLFEQNVKKHIDDIAQKYILPGETADQAVMFIPAEAIFAQINAYHYGLVEYSHQKRVWLASPTTLMAQLTTLLVVLRNLEREKHAEVIHENLKALGKEFGRYKERWDGLARHIDTVAKDVHEIHTTTQKIGNRFDKISQVDIELLSGE